MNTSHKNTIVIGAGFSGLATAILLAQEGCKVTLLEKNEAVGGRALARHFGDYQFDLGPSWYLMPEVFDRFFQKIGTSANKELKLTRLNPAYRIFYDKNETIDLPHSRKEIDLLFDTLEPEGSKKLKKYLQQTKHQYDVAMNKFVYADLSWKSALDPELVRAVFELDILKSWKALVEKYFNSPKIQKLLLYPAAFLGSAPKDTPAMYALLNYIDLEQGVWYPEGGMGAIAKALARIAQENGVEIILNTTVTQIKTNDGVAHQVVTENETYEADTVVSCGDYAHTELHLLSKSDRTFTKVYWESKTLAPSGFVINLGLKKQLKSLKHHNLFLFEDWDHHFEQVFDTPQWPDNPSFYVCAPTKSDKTLAPNDKEVLFILVPIAAGLKDTPNQKQAFRNQIISKLEGMIDQKIEPLIEEEYVMSVTDFANNYLAYQGTTFGLAHILWQTAFLRPPHRSKKVNNLFYAGQYTHPGVGVPTALISAQITVNLINKSYG